MRYIVAIAFLASAVFMYGQDVVPDKVEIARDSGGCGPAETQFDVKADKTKHLLAQQQEDKAVVYILEDEKRDPGKFYIGSDVTTRAGLDGKWVGANHGKSYFFFAVDPGEHQVCTDWQSSLKSRSKQGAARTFTAEAGKAYYFRVRVEQRENREPALSLEMIDSAEAKFQISTWALSESHPKKVKGS